MLRYYIKDTKPWRVCNDNDFAVNDGYFDIEMLGSGVYLWALLTTSALLMKLDDVIKKYETIQFCQSTRLEWLCDDLSIKKNIIWISYKFGTSNLILKTWNFSFVPCKLTNIPSNRYYKVLTSHTTLTIRFSIQVFPMRCPQSMCICNLRDEAPITLLT